MSAHDPLFANARASVAWMRTWASTLTYERDKLNGAADTFSDILDEFVRLRVALQDVQGIALNGPDDGKTTEQRIAYRLDRIDKRVTEALSRVRS